MNISPIKQTITSVLLYQTEPEFIIAKSYSAIVANYWQWKLQDFNVQCSANTHKGNRCRNIVTTGHMVGLSKWIELSDRYCEIHESGVTNTYASLSKKQK